MPLFPNLSPSERQKHLAALKAEHKALSASEKKADFAKRPPCPYCGQSHVHSMGMRNQIRHFRCSSCKKSFCSRTGTSFYWLHLPQKFNLYAQNMLGNGYKTLKEMSRLHGISVNTAFEWRHKVLASLNCTPEQFDGFIELRNSCIGFSRKGIKNSKNAGREPEKPKALVQLLITADYYNNAGFDIARIGQLKVSDIEAKLLGRIAIKSVIIGPYNKSLQKFNHKRKLGMTLFDDKFNPHELDDKKAKALDFSLKLLANTKAHGVSTKYLHHYARWVVLTTEGVFEKDNKQIENDLHYNITAWPAYANLEKTYARFSNKFSDEAYVKTLHRVWKRTYHFSDL